MTVIEKRQLLIAKIETLQEAQLDKTLELFENFEAKEQDLQAKIDALLAYTNQKYKKVWEVLA